MISAKAPKFITMVGQQIERNSLQARLIERYQAQQNIAGVRNRTVGEKALQIGLRDGRDIAQSHREQPHRAEQRHPELMRVEERDQEDPQQQGERRCFRRHRYMRGDGRGGAPHTHPAPTYGKGRRRS